MQPITDYTNTDKIRGAIGVTDNEITDEMLVDQDLAVHLLVDLEGWVPDHAAIYAASTAVNAEAEDVLRGRYLTLFSMWFCAARAAEMTLAIPAMTTDGKARIQRFSDLDLEAGIARARAYAVSYRRLLEPATGAAAASNTYSLMSRATPGYDPVTNT